MTTMAPLLARSALSWAIECVKLVTPVGVQDFAPYPYQAAFLADRSTRVMVNKARQVGVSQSAAILAAHHAIFTAKATVLVVSRDQNAAGGFVSMVYDVLDGLDESPVFEKRGTFECLLANGSRIVSQAATPKAGRGLTATLVIMDEAAFMEHDVRIFRAVQPTLSRGGRLIVISTPNGQANLFYRVWHAQEAGEWARHRVHWRDCPAFDKAWYERERPKYTAADWAQEYDLDFITSGGAAFNPDDIDAMRDGWLGLQPPDPNRTYVSGWDIGRRRDATVGITVDLTELPYQIVAFERVLKAPYAQIGALIDSRAEQYDARPFVESNSIGDPVIESLDCNAQPFVTSAKSKADMLTKLIRHVENGELKCGVPEVLSELKGYQFDDQKLVQDCVMSLAIALNEGARGGMDATELRALVDGGDRRLPDGRPNWEAIDQQADEWGDEQTEVWTKVY